MHLKRLDLLGFKTFAAQTVVEFHPGITAIVGPNGSGKSNIADALRWVLGEQSARQLRARRAEDVIFAGGAGRAPAGLAEVTLTVEAEDLTLLDVIAPPAGRITPDGIAAEQVNGHALSDRCDLAGEIAVTRRIHRSAESEYLLNNRRVRLRDVGDVMARARLGQNPYAIISQGMVDATLNLRPEERRGLLDEAADVRRHQQRIAEAQERLAATLGNLTRVMDLLNELTPRLSELQQAAERAEAYFRIQRQVVVWLKHWYALQRVALQDRASETAGALARAQAGAAVIAERREALAAQVATVVERRHQLRADHEAAIARRTELDRIIGEQRRELAVVEERLETARRRRAESAAEVQTVHDELLAAERAGQTLAASVRRLEASIAESEQTERDAQAAIAVLEAERQEVAGRVERREAETRRAQLATADARGRLTQVEHRIEEIEGHVAQRAADVEQASAAVTAAHAAFQSAQAALDAAALALDSRSGDVERLRSEIQAANETIAAVRAAQLEQESERRHLEKRAQLLASRSDPATGIPAGVRAVVQAARPSPENEGQPGLRGVHGLVGELIRVPKEYEVAIDVALGGRLHDIVVDRWTDAEAAIDLLKRDQRGRATFLPLDTIRPAARGNSPRPSGVFGIAADLVDADSTFRLVVEHLLGRTIVVADLAVARALLRQGLRGEQIVTVAGEIVRSSGAITGGSLRQAADGGLLARERELRETRASLERLAQTIEATKRQGSAAAAALETKSSALAAAEGASRDASAAVRAARDRRDAAQREQQRIEQQHAWASDLVAREQRELETLRQRRAAFQAELARLAGETQSTTSEDDFDRDHLASLDRRLQQQREQANQRQLATSSLRATHQAERAVLQRHHEGERRLQGQLEVRRGQVAEADRLIAVLSEQSISLHAVAARHDAERAEIAATIDPITSELSWLELQEQSLQGRTKEAAEEAAAAERTLARAEAEVDQVRAELAHIEARLLAELNAEELADAVPGEAPPPPDLDPDALRRRIDRLRGQLRQLGPVNPRAVEEYESAEQRHRFLTEQAQDLEATEASLRDAIRETEARVRAGFEAAFHALNDEFRRAFTTLFGGGRAELILTDDQDFATSGIDIVAQPPGKRLMPLSLLSGGERALTGIALVFGLLGVNPTPFCILDEVDAALDEANVARFANAVTSMAGETQFVLVTHNRATMEAADLLYGVTMNADGVSRLLSLRLDKALELAERRG